MAKNSKRKEKLQKASEGTGNEVEELTSSEATFLGLQKRDKSAPPDTAFVALKYFQPQHECLSDWEKDELGSLSNFITKLSCMSWIDIQKTGGKLGSKVGVGFTKHKDRKKLPDCPVLDQISEDIDFFELRVSEKARVHGFRAKSTFFLVWLDRNHQIYPQ